MGQSRKAFHSSRLRRWHLEQEEHLMVGKTTYDAPRGVKLDDREDPDVGAAAIETETAECLEVEELDVFLNVMVTEAMEVEDLQAPTFPPMQNLGRHMLYDYQICCN
eukprot:1899674-Amphidinium_carterae.1